MRLKTLGPGFIAALSGFEITNIVVFMRLGAVYGFSGFIIAALMILPLTYLQQVILLAINMPNENILVFLKKHRLLSLVFCYTISSAGLFTAYANLIGISIILSIIYGSYWIHYAILFIAIIWLVLSKTTLTSRILKILSFASLFLLVYVALFILNASKLIKKPLAFEPIGYFDLLALWGASAAPYSIIIQMVDKESNYESIYAGALTTTIISISVASIGFIYLYPANTFIVADSLKPIFLFGRLTLIVYSIGLCSVVFLTLTSIYTASRIMTEEISCAKTIRMDAIFNYMLLLGVFLTFIIEHLTLVREEEVLYTSLIISSSAIIGVLFTGPLIVITLFYTISWLKCRENIYLVNMIYLLVLTIFSTIIGVMGLIDLI